MAHITKTNPDLINPAEMLPVITDKELEVYQDEAGNYHIYFGDEDGEKFYRGVIAKTFHQEAEISYYACDCYLEIRSAGMPIMRIPKANNGVKQVDVWADEISM